MNEVGQRLSVWVFGSGPSISVPEERLSWSKPYFDSDSSFFSQSLLGSDSPPNMAEALQSRTEGGGGGWMPVSRVPRENFQTGRYLKKAVRCSRNLGAVQDIRNQDVCMRRNDSPKQIFCTWRIVEL